jgi:hypothetical protein
MLAYRNEKGESVLATGLDTQRVTIEGRPVIGQIVIGRRDVARVMMFDAETGEPLQDFGRPEGARGWRSGEAFRKFCADCRAVVAGVEIPFGGSDLDRIAKQYRAAQQELLETVSFSKSYGRRYEELRPYDKGGPVPRRDPHFVKTEWGNVRVKIDERSLVIDTTDRGREVPLTRKRPLFGKQMLDVYIELDCNHERNEIGLARDYLGRELFHVLDHSTKKRIGPESLATKIRDGVIQSVQQFVSSQPDFLKKESDGWKAGFAAYCREQLEELDRKIVKLSGNATALATKMEHSPHLEYQVTLEPEIVP